MPLLPSKRGAPRRTRCRSAVLAARAAQRLGRWLLAATAALAGCAGEGGGGSKSPFFIVSCSLGCNEASSETFGPLGCGVTGVSLNEEIAFEFNAPVDLSSVNSRSFGVSDLESGVTPSGLFQLDPANPNRLLYRPSLGFDSQGLPTYGLEPGRSYTVRLPGTAQDGGADFVRSVDGVENVSRFTCTIVALDQVEDVAEGAPRVEVFLDVAADVDPATGQVVTVAEGVLASGETLLEDVYRGTQIKMVFDDIIDPATLVNPISGFTNTVSIGIDADGDVAGADDRVALPGDYLLAFDFAASTTTLLFTPSIDLPSRGPDEDTPRLLAIDLGPMIADLGGERLANPGVVVGVPEFRAFEATVLPDGEGEDFSTTDHRDELRTGATWGGGRLGPGVGGGSGRLGDFVPDAGEVVLDTDGQVFSAPNLIDDYDPVTGMPGEADVVVDDGLFEFAHFRIGPGARLRIVGSRPARILVRGALVVDGVIDVSGEDVPMRASMPCDPLDDEVPNTCSFGPPITAADFLGGAGGAPGPGGGVGGRGGDLPDSDPTLQAVGGLDNPNAVIVTQGRDGAGVPFPDTLAPTTTVGGGGGGVQWPTQLPSNASDVGNFVWEIFTCVSTQLGGSGAGGAGGSPGAPGITGSSQIFSPSLPPEAVGGDLTGLLDALQRELAPERGHLRGGAGGGGGGAHAAQTRNQSTFIPCLPALAIGLYRPSIGNGGGGGGGAIELHAGTRLSLSGTVEANGGSGGGVIRIPIGSQVGAMERVAAGGGGAGGAILLRAPELDIDPFPARLQVRGGLGGIGVEDPVPTDSVINFSLGGAGGAGVVRVEAGGGDGPDFDEVAKRFVPRIDELPDLFGTPEIGELLSVGPFVPQASGPEARSGAQSCWLQPPGNPFLVSYPSDGPDPGDGADPDGSGLGGFGWDMDVWIAGVGAVSWRTPGALFPDLSLEELLGSDLGASPVVVRFQGARALEPIFDLCTVDESGPFSPLFPGSLTPWVRHPAELNEIFESGARKPNLLRYQIVFDPDHPFFEQIEGIARIAVRARPE